MSAGCIKCAEVAVQRNKAEVTAQDLKEKMRLIFELADVALKDGHVDMSDRDVIERIAGIAGVAGK